MESEQRLSEILTKITSSEEIENTWQNDPLVGKVSSNGKNNGKEVYKGRLGGLYFVGKDSYNRPYRRYISEQVVMLSKR